MVLLPQRRRYVIESATTGVFSVSEPYPITIDLPALTARRVAFLARDKMPA